MLNHKLLVELVKGPDELILRYWTRRGLRRGVLRRRHPLVHEAAADPQRPRAIRLFFSMHGRPRRRPHRAAHFGIACFSGRAAA